MYRQLSSMLKIPDFGSLTVKRPCVSCRKSIHFQKASHYKMTTSHPSRSYFPKVIKSVHSQKSPFSLAVSLSFICLFFVHLSRIYCAVVKAVMVVWTAED